MPTHFSYLVCDVCGARNYRRRRGERPRSPEERLKTQKFCKHCSRHTLHKESS